MIQFYESISYAFIKDNKNCNSQYFIILNKLQLTMSYMYYENRKVINNSPASSRFQSPLSETAQRYFYKYFSIILIPIPSIIGISN
jgi:CRISPR/Cas system CSM-associated protein Csm2 small subunit